MNKRHFLLGELLWTIFDAELFYTRDVWKESNVYDGNEKKMSYLVVTNKC